MNGIIDTHIHTWDMSICLNKDTSYAPNYIIPVTEVIGILHQHAVQMGVLVQPSFVNFDNKYLLQCLQDYPHMLRGVINFDPKMTQPIYEQYQAHNICGVRFNILSCPYLQADFFDTYAIHLNMLDRLQYIIEIHAHINDYADILPHISTYNSPIIIDHMGLSQCKNNTILDKIIAKTHTQSMYIKISAPYRLGKSALQIAQHIIQNASPEKLLWGSDMPYTRFEHKTNYQQQLDFIYKVCPENTDAILFKNAQVLFNF